MLTVQGKSVLTKNFSVLKHNNSCLLITCKGIKKNGIHEKCPFIHEGDWGDLELTEHQNFHDAQESQNYSWLGFDTSQAIGKFSGRDGKSS
ncbi:hypothetical protein [Nitrosopumilus maritimus]|uniref:hypothetical protein n=1 Tax=Nitrosopumilus maritimus TaxID=338192 RepID=UPI001EE5D259|nr:hypothetical protein [Nitrosopumilus maritimus]